MIAVLLLLLKPEENKEVMVQRGLRDFGERGILVCCGTAAAVGVVCCGVLWSVVVWCGVSCGVIGESGVLLCCVGMMASTRAGGSSASQLANLHHLNARICITITPHHDRAKSRKVERIEIFKSYRSLYVCTNQNPLIIFQHRCLDR